ncbi:LOW QUALITY PROTEIN: hypothetical protein PHMEG_00021933 [Phytophthora megakarya]|uniref:RNA-directed DNA polymerase n=1 Tax=Phytophthora megakarya TaxID=4795 RepID=A0A225VKM9_9STRA|nr:LOW QUALITY PROTEIN: hypothetical protein PHMEG_00021933 [Phytophthora megakarya]
MQHHFHLMQKETKEPRTMSKTRTATPAATAKATALKAERGGAVKLKPSGAGGREGACNGGHRMRECPTATNAEKEAALASWREKRKSQPETAKHVAEGISKKVVLVNGILEIPLCPDTGSDRNIISRDYLNDLKELDAEVTTAPLDEVITVKVTGGAEFVCRESATLDLKLTTAAGPLHLPQVPVVVLEGPEEEFLLGCVTLKEIGIDIDHLLEQLAGGAQAGEIGAADEEDLPPEEELRFEAEGDVTTAMENLVEQAVANWFAEAHVEGLRELVHEFPDVFRLHVGIDSPADVEPLEVQVVPGATPFRCKLRKYPERQRAFLREYVQQLVDAGLSLDMRCSACQASNGKYRMTVDYRPVNRLTVPLTAATPNLAVVTQSVKGAYGFGSFDLYKGFWQLPLSPKSQEFFSFLTEDGVVTPTRVPQGASDSALHFQAQMQDCFWSLLYNAALVWIDDILLFARSPGVFLEKLRAFFIILRQCNLKLNAIKCKLFSNKVVWCGKVIDGAGIEHDPTRLQALRNMPPPPTAAALQHFLCAINWLRAHGGATLEEVMAARGRRKSCLTGVDLTWTKDDESAFRVVLQLLSNSSKLFFPDLDAHVCLFSDASASGWAVALTHVREWSIDTPMLVCRGGAFTKSQANWSVVEKEGYPIARACGDLEYLLDRENGFHIYCDHSNLIQIFAPGREVKQHVNAGLCGSLGDATLSSISPPPAEPAVTSIARVHHVTTRSESAVSCLRPLEDASFVWPTLAEVKTIQARSKKDMPGAASVVDGLATIDGKIWIPPTSHSLLVRLFIVAHCGAQGHRGEHVMAEQLSSRFSIQKLSVKVSQFMRDCLLCKHVKCGKIIQRAWTTTREVTRRNERLHMDYLFMGDTYGSTKYVLVLKDEMTHFCELPADSAGSEVVVAAILDWFKHFGLPESWESANGSYFKAEVMEQLSKRLKANQSFVPVYTPCINGTVERINRDILQVLRAMLLEFQLDTRNWLYLLPLIQANLNHAPVASLGNHAPIEAFTGLPAPSALDTIAVPSDKGTRLVPVDPERVSAHVEKYLHDMHKEAATQREKKRLYEMARAKGRICNFVVGDFVLWSRVDSRLQGSKLLVRWVGPFRVVEARQHSFIVQHLITKDKVEVHGSRLKFYCDSSLNVTAELKEHVAKQGIVLGVRASITGSTQWEVQVAWIGLEDVENSWEPLRSIYVDVPTKVQEYIDSSAIPDLDWLQSTPVPED